MTTVDEHPCPQCGRAMEVGAVYGSPWLVWGQRDTRPGRWGSIVGAERLGRMSAMTSAKIAAVRCVSCRVGSFTY